MATGVNIEDWSPSNSFAMAEHSMCQPGRPLPHGRVPARLIVSRWLPDHEVHRVLLVGRDLHPSTRDHVIDRTARERAVFLVGLDREQHMPLGGIGIAFIYQCLRHRRPSAFDVLGAARLVVRAERAQRVHVVVIPADRLVGDAPGRCLQRLVRALGRHRLLDDPVVHVREVAHVSYCIFKPETWRSRRYSTSNTTTGRALPICARS